jgi:heme/copper-type cytochrome/quinol oxidase subunit 2
MARRSGATAALGAGALLLAGCAQQGVRTQGQDIHDLYVRIAILAVPVFVAVEAYLLWCVVRYRKRDEQPAPQGAGSGRILAVIFECHSPQNSAH